MRKRTYPLAAWVGSWTAQSPKRTTPETLSPECQFHLRRLADVFEAMDYEAERLLKEKLHEPSDNLWGHTTEGPLSREEQRSDLQPFLTRKQENGTPRSIKGTLAAIRSLEYLRFWTAAWAYAEHVWSYKTAPASQGGHFPVLRLLQLWSEAISVLDEIKEELIGSLSDELHSAYSAAVTKAQTFEGLAMRMISINPEFVLPQSDAISGLLRAETKRRNGGNPQLVADMIKIQAGLTAITFIVTVGASAMLGVAWKFGTSGPGIVEEMDFWTQIQSSLMQLLGLFTAIYPLYRVSSGPPWIWALVFVTAGAICSIAAVPTFLFLRPFWSSILSFFGAAAQAVVTLQLSLLAMEPSVQPGVKQD